MKNKLIQILIFSTLLTACVSQKEQDAASKAADIYGAESYSVEHKNFTDTQKGLQKIIVLKLKNIKLIAPDYPIEKVASISALTFIKNLDKKDYQDYDQLEIDIENSVNGIINISKTQEITYEIKKIVNTIPLINVVTDFLDKFKSNDTLKLKTILDTKIADSVNSLFNSKAKIDSICGKQDKINISGFAYDSINETKEPIVIIWAETTNGACVTNYRFNISEKSKKIIFIDFKTLK